MGWITVLENLAEPENAVTEEWNLTYVEFLEVRYPDGFKGTHKSYLNNALLPVEDYDLALCSDDRITLVIVPAAPLAVYIIPALISLAVSFVVNIIVNKLFPTKRPAAAEIASAEVTTPTAGTVYSLTVPTNSAKLGDPIPVIYGRVMATPDIASFAYTFYSSNIQFVDLLLCLGHGTFDIHNVYVSSTPSDQMAPNVFHYEVFPKSRHLESFGKITNAYINTGRHPFFENVVTSVEVDGQLIRPGTTNQRTGTVNSAGKLTLNSPIGSQVVGTVVYPVDPSRLRFNKANHLITAVENSGYVLVSNVPWQPEVTWNLATPISYFFNSSQHIVYLSSNSPPASNGWIPPSYVPYWDEITIHQLAEISTFRAKFGGNAGAGSAEVFTMDIASFKGTPLQDSVQISVTSCTIKWDVDTTFSVKIPAVGPVVGPYIAAGPGTLTQELQVDLLFPGGLYLAADTGGLLPITVALSVGITKVNNAGDEIGGTVWYPLVYTSATNTPLRYTQRFAVVLGRYSVKMVQTSQATGRAKDQTQVQWTGLKAILWHDPAEKIYGDVTLISIRFQAREAVVSTAINRIGVDCTRNTPRGGGFTSNVADHFEDILTNTAYGGGRPASEIDVDTMAELRAASKGFNGIFDQKMSLWSALEAVCQPTRASPVTNGQLVGTIVDKPQSAVKYVFNQSNMVKESVEFSWGFDQVDDTDGFEVEWRNPTTWVAQYVRYPSTSIDPESVTLMGCVNRTIASEHAEYLWKRKLYNRKIIKFKTELDGHLPQLNDKIQVVTDLGGAENYLVVTISPQDDFQVEIECIKYDERVYQ